MSTANAVSRGMANPRGESPCTNSGSGLHLVDLLRRLWPRKTAAELSAVTGASERMCKYWLARRYDLSADALAALLRSQHGLDVLANVMGDDPPVWWEAFYADARLAELNLRIEALAEDKRRLRERVVR